MAKEPATREAQNTSTTIGRGNTQTLVKAEGTGPAEVKSSEGSVDDRHPEYLDREDEWQLMRITARGTTAVKEAGETYLPMPTGFTIQPDKGKKLYDGYITRAQFPELISPTLMGMVGVIHRMEAKIEMPTSMEPLWERATKDGLPLEAFHRSITMEILINGRYGVLVDANPEQEGGSDIPFMCGYTAETIINWSEDSDFYVLDETRLVRKGFRWDNVPKWRVLTLNDTKQYEQQTYETANKTPGEVIQPRALGAKALDKIPFTVFGTRNLKNAPADPPLLGVSRAAISAYQLSADYRHQLYMSGQETLVCVNMDPPAAVGAGVIIHATSSSKDSPQPDAFYVGPEGTGIEAHKVAIEDEKNNAARAGAKLFETEGQGEESGEAKRIRYAAETATLISIAQTSASGLERALRDIALLMGEDPKKVIVTPDLSFMDSTLTGEEATKLVKLWQDGAISYETLYENLQRGEIASAERDFEEEKELIDGETEDELANATVAGMLDPKTGLPIPIKKGQAIVKPAPGVDPKTGLPIEEEDPKKKVPVEETA